MSTIFELCLPEVGEGVTEAFVAVWLKDVGDPVVAGDPVLEVMTDKANIDVPSPVSGTLKEQRFAEEARVEVGEIVAVIEVTT
ncbi:biotin/lipoyl-containing protein [Nocardioides humi]|uniref:Lipoyl-binding domain-containing protein n=1 Tax=Nocardioides humi TaxID=449461 RepID=A0ABN2AGF6_9ACTN|nr:biotin/lipoyl-containing protein [Nocardioides humi]